MDKDYFTQLTSDLYRLTLLFPEGEPLKNKMRGEADDILKNLLLILRGDFRRSKNLVFDTDKKLEVLEGYFSIVDNQNWISPQNLMEVREAYSSIEDEIEEMSNLLMKMNEQKTRGKPPSLYNRERPKEREETQKEQKQEEQIEAPKKELSISLSSRQKKIVDYLKENEKAQVGEVHSTLDSVTKRTLRRDFKDLMKKGVVNRKGNRNNTFYKLTPEAQKV